MHKSHPSHFIKYIALIFAGVSDVTSINPDVSLLDLGLDSLMGVEVKQVLERHLDTVMQIKDIRLLTFKQIADIKNIVSNTKTEMAPNAQNVEETSQTTAVIQRQLVPSECLVKMPTASSEGPVPAMFIVHPIEGVVEALRDVTSSLHCDVYGLQFTRDAAHVSSIEELAGHYIKVLRY